MTNKVYIGSMQGRLKTRMNLHNQKFRRIANQVRTLDSYAEHFAALCPAKLATVKHIRSLMPVKVLWEGNPLLVNKTFGKIKCSLCMKERILILRQFYTDKSRLINESNEFYGSCRHRAKFHRLTTTDLLLTGGATIRERTSKIIVI